MLARSPPARHGVDAILNPYDEHDLSHDDDDSHHATATSEKPKFYMEKLHCLLDDCPADIALWNADGTAFTVLDAPAFERRVLPLYFKRIKFDSFARQLNSYGFKRGKKRHGHIYEFQHPQFRRGERDQLPTMKSRMGAPDTQETLQTRIDQLTDVTETLKAEVDAMKEMLHMLLQKKLLKAKQRQRAASRDD
ncbi:hypothetical protein SDRG_03702 [Saprolegnia diclina VS20]|uniref:HSF-type DNA-binding domain-containing protein n=2 Tax=Saprolegnia TaxID=4769 RepID=A0A067CRR7_SAPPC|nr:hypothetical protein SDRG_03702 [Saprolegnia diclina VS20]XP_012199578.1 hypothetical protein SPRG_05469 [Saprolegnia parasitica CBS 223.65]EQC38738.1 hypothetical protein SDRG_03702 [Saprolegnia diclina VS20]KDO29512.1 hypothetical protein SPRG_05469 [Saprolegnia parasitica CBS 223.65]|eukprot:XP_008607562.1 hypothetical protein SDRG_03702 [Saprolegnia diclina VS20]